MIILEPASYGAIREMNVIARAILYDKDVTYEHILGDPTTKVTFESIFFKAADPTIEMVFAFGQYEKKAPKGAFSGLDLLGHQQVRSRIPGRLISQSGIWHGPGLRST